MTSITVHCSRHQWIKYSKYSISLECVIPLRKWYNWRWVVWKQSVFKLWGYFLVIVWLEIFICQSDSSLSFINGFFLGGGGKEWRRIEKMAKPHRPFSCHKVVVKKIRYYVWDGWPPWHFVFSKNVSSHFSNILRFGKNLKSILPSTSLPPTS